MDTSTTAAPLKSPSTIEATKPEPKGLGGWLILVAVGLFLSPLYLMSSLHEAVQTVKSPMWQQLTSIASPYYHPHIAPGLYVEIFFNLSLIFFTLYLIYLFFTKAPHFPKFYIGYLWYAAAGVTLDLYFMSILPLAAFPAGAAVISTLKGIAAAIIWTLYMKKSVRVRNTFVKRLNDI